MDHQVRAGAGVRSVIRIREPGIDREILAGIRVHQAGSDGVEALRRLAVARLDLGTQLARPAADRISAKECEAPAVVLLPNLELRFLLEDAHQDRRFLLHLLGFELGQHTFRQRLHVATDGDRPAAAAGKGDHCSDRGRHQQRPRQRVVSEELVGGARQSLSGRRRKLVSRFRSSHHCAALSFANLELKDTRSALG